jgi:hypothetical protein
MLAKADEISALTEEHLAIVVDALRDGVITVQEHQGIIASARTIRLASYFQASRTRIAVRLIRGRKLDREILGEIQDCLRLEEQEKAASAWSAEAA